MSSVSHHLISEAKKHDIKVGYVNFSDFGKRHIEELLANKKLDSLLDDVVQKYIEAAEGNDVVFFDALTSDKSYVGELNRKVAVTLDSKIVLVSADLPDVIDQIKLAESFTFFDVEILGCMIENKASDLENLPRGIKLLKGVDWLKDIISKEEIQHVTAPFFRYNLIDKAKKVQKTVVLPEGNEWRTITAANICVESALAKCVLLGKESEILSVAKEHGVNLSSKVQILDPDNIIPKYTNPMLELRKHKGETLESVTKQLKDNVVLGTMMVQMGDVDGLVSGAVHTTANTIRPALQLIKTKPDAKLVSSLYFMALPHQVLAFADCAININPNSEELADIAIQSADTASQLGIEPRIAMITYGTGDSAHGDDIDKVKEATRIIKERRHDLLVEGPIQYDAATVMDVAKIKLPNSKVAGKATVLIFPDLSAGNTVAKAVQRSANVVAIGPLSQGLNKPANDLSRGCLVDDIVFTIVLTAIQANYN